MPAPNDDDDYRYHRVLEEFNKFAIDFQEYKLAREKALNELERRLIDQSLIYWRSTAAALRQMSDWTAATEDRARKERKIERWIVRIGMAAMIAFLLFDVYLRLR